MLDTVINFVKDHAFGVTIIVFFTIFAHSFFMAVTRRLVKRAVRPEKFSSEHEEKQRENTLLSTLNTVIRTIVWVVSALLLLAEFDINIAPLLAGAGIAGVALGFGAQSMVKDFLAGFFILMENHYRVGDIVEINQTVTGAVEQITLRETVLRDLDGMVHHIGNGQITISTNMTMEYANVNLDIGVGYATDIDQLEKIINKVGEQLSTDEQWQHDVLEPPKMLRISDFADSAIIVKITGKTAPMRQWAVTGELRRRLKKAFDKDGVEIPFPQRVVQQLPTAKTPKK